MLCTMRMFYGEYVRVVDVIASRGERLELLVDKTEDLSNRVCVWLCVYVSFCKLQAVEFHRAFLCDGRHILVDIHPSLLVVSVGAYCTCLVLAAI